MAKKTNYYYVLVITDHGPVFVTSVDNRNKVAHWNDAEVPKELGKYYAEDLAMGLNLNGTYALVVCNRFELDNQPYRYDMGGFEWRAKEA